MDDEPHEHLEEGDPMYSRGVSIDDYMHSDEEKWEVNSHRFDKYPIYDDDDANRTSLSLSPS